MDSLALVLGLTSILLLALTLQSQWSQMNLLKTSLEESKQENKDLLNRLMTSNWTEYQQMTHSNSSSADVITMSDEDELRRWAEATGETAPVGEVFVDFGDEYNELGL